MRIIHFWLPSGAHRRNCGPSFCRQAADLVRLLHLGLFRAAHWLNCEPSFCRQAVDLVHVSDFGLATDAYWLATEGLVTQCLVSFVDVVCVPLCRAYAIVMSKELLQGSE